MSYIIIGIDPTNSTFQINIFLCENLLPYYFRTCLCLSCKSRAAQSKRDSLLVNKERLVFSRSQSFLLPRLCQLSSLAMFVYCYLRRLVITGDKSRRATLAKRFGAIRLDDVLTQKKTKKNIHFSGIKRTRIKKISTTTRKIAREFSMELEWFRILVFVFQSIPPRV